MSATAKPTADAAAQRWVIKIGSSLLTAEGQGLDTEAIAAWAGQIAQLRTTGVEVLIVSSGSIVEGMQRLDWSSRPEEVHKLQAAAAVGQMGLVQAWESCFQARGLHTAQVLLISEDVANRRRYLNARKTLNTLLDIGVVPVINENDTVATDEICFGDNDRLAALAANLVDADHLIILTDQQGLYEQDPRANPSAKLVKEASARDSALLSMAGKSSGIHGRGGMQSKIQAARQAAVSGTDSIIAYGREPDVLLRLAQQEAIGTRLLAEQQPMQARKQWIAALTPVRGQLTLDAGAVEGVRAEGRSLLPVGVTAVSGTFERGDVVSCLAPNGEEIARGLVNYSSQDAQRVIGKNSRQMAAELVVPGEPELIHRDNLVLP